MHTAIVQALVFNLIIATVLAGIGFAMLWGAFTRFEGLSTVLFAAVGLLFGFWSIKWNLTPGRIADASRVYDVESWETVAVIWPAFFWTILFLISVWSCTSASTSVDGPAEMQE